MFQPLKSFMPVDLGKGYRTQISPVFSHLNLINIGGLKGYNARIKNFDPNGLILGYAIEPIGSWSSGKPSYALVNKNGINHESLSFTIEESISGKILSVLASMLGQMFEGGATNIGSGEKFGLAIEIKQFVSVSVKNKPYLICSRKFKLNSCWVTAINIGSLSATGSGTMKYDVTINPLNVEIYDTYESSLKSLKQHIVVETKKEAVSSMDIGNLRYPNNMDAVEGVRDGN